MGQRARKQLKREEEAENETRKGRLQLMLPLAAIIREDLRSFVLQCGMEAVGVMLAEERDELCGARYGRGQQDKPSRAGSTLGELVLGGRRVRVKRPRVRQNNKEVALSSWECFADTDVLEERAVEQMLIGVSTRNYDRSLEPVPEALASRGTSRSAVSRRFVLKTQTTVDQWLKRDLSNLPLAVIMIDGIEYREQVVVIALGIDGSGGKHVLGVAQGATENSTVCTTLLSNLVERGVDPAVSRLFVIDGSKALRKGISDMFGDRAIVQRCQLHKRRNVQGHLPESMHASVTKQMLDAYKSKTKATAKKRLKQLANHLETDHPDAAASITEGLDETLTVLDLSLSPLLIRALVTTNAIENMNGGIRRLTRNIKRWRDGSMVLRWTAAALCELENRFRRIRGCNGMPSLIQALRRNDAKLDNALDLDKKAA